MDQITAPPTQYCLYARKSSESDEKQALSIDSQIKEMTKLAERDGLYIKEIRRESHSAKASGQRPVYNELIEDIRKGLFTGILTWAPDRLSRNAGDLGSLVDLIDQKLLHEIRTYGQKFTNSPNEKFLLMILGSQAKLENDNRGLNVKRGLRAKVEMGLWPGVAPIGYLNEKRTDRKCHIVIDPLRAPIVKKIFEKAANDGWSGRQIHAWLKNDLNFRSKNNKYFALSNLYLMLRNTFYYGSHEYPKGSGNWYTGNHQPIISKELFEKVQERMLDYQVGKSKSKEFAFTKLITCGLCGSGITADEKFKKQKNGTIHRYVYYGCTKYKDLNCKLGYMREEDLLNQILELIDKISLEELGMKEKIVKEVERYHKFQSGVMGINPEQKEKQKRIDIKNYAKFILKEGQVFEKRDLLSNLKSHLTLENKLLNLKN
ncbi:MAG: recombinase family protein [Patescibacteria group bacterium]|jgi:DNA invertase Pin-like site-specific DNA recombinase